MDKVIQRNYSTQIQTAIVRLIVLVIALFLAQRILARPLATLSWPTTEGIIISSDVIKTKGASPGDDPDSWHPQVRYRYFINGAEYLSDRIEVFNIANGNTSRFAEKAVSRYPPGMQVKVYYYPEYPAFAVLEPGIPDNDLLALFAFLLGLITLGVIALYSIIDLLKILNILRRVKPGGH